LDSERKITQKPDKGKLVYLRPDLSTQLIFSHRDKYIFAISIITGDRMQRKTHVALVALLCVLVWTIHRFDLGLIIFASLGAIFPDLDYSRGSKLHRKLLHNLWAISATSLAGALLIYPAVGLAFFFGAITHLAADALTPSGVHPLYPKKFHLRVGPLLYTSSRRERRLAGVLMVFALFIFFIGISGYDGLGNMIVVSFIPLSVSIVLFKSGFLPRVFR
jgi:membrane-bound metal-dependent hydrolase YbcI (DUF457 family)